MTAQSYLPPDWSGQHTALAPPPAPTPPLYNHTRQSPLRASLLSSAAPSLQQVLFLPWMQVKCFSGCQATALECFFSSSLLHLHSAEHSSVASIQQLRLFLVKRQKSTSSSSTHQQADESPENSIIILQSSSPPSPLLQLTHILPPAPPTPPRPAPCPPCRSSTRRSSTVKKGSQRTAT